MLNRIYRGDSGVSHASEGGRVMGRAAQILEARSMCS